MVQKSETGFIVLCGICEEHTALVVEDGDYYCGECWLKRDDEKLKASNCDCGATKHGWTHSIWCSSQQDGAQDNK